MLRYACDNGFKYFDFGRSTVGEGTYRFKKTVGAEDKGLFWYTWSKRVVKQGISESEMRNLLIKVWRNIPLTITEILGPYLRRHIEL